MTWQPNIHSSLFLNMYEYLDKTSELEEIDGIIKAYELYLEQIRAQGLEPLLSVTRAWRLVKFVDAGMVTLTSCCKCNGKFVTHTFELTKNYVCGLCEPPARAGKARRRFKAVRRNSALSRIAWQKKPASRGLFVSCDRACYTRAYNGISSSRTNPAVTYACSASFSAELSATNETPSRRSPVSSGLRTGRARASIITSCSATAS